jgi:hypothetical protein
MKLPVAALASKRSQNPWTLRLRRLIPFYLCVHKLAIPQIPRPLHDIHVLLLMK